MSAYGIPQEDIAATLDIDPKTLRKHYSTEIATAHVRANSKVAETAYKMATSGEYPAMTIFWLKTRLHWRETDRLEITDPEGKPLGSGAVATLMDRLESIAGRKAAALASNGHELPEGTDE